MSDPEIWALNRGGHSPRKVYAAYHAAMHHEGQPTVILAKTIKGYGMGARRRGPEHHPPAEEDERGGAAGLPRPLRRAADRRADAMRPPSTGRRADSPEMTYLRERREALGGSLPARRADVAVDARCPRCRPSTRCSRAAGERAISTTMAFVRALSTLLRDKTIGPHVVPIVPDESRTFGMEGMFRQLGIFSQVGQLYRPEDAEQLMFYREDKKGQILEEGITEAGALSSWIAAGTSYANHGVADDPLLHLLLDVRLPADRRPDLGRRRQPRARLPARRHVRAHHAERRGPAARGRPQPRRWPPPSPTAAPTTRPSATRWR